MNEQDFRGALHDTMTLAVAPPPMNEVAMLDAAKRAHRQRRATAAAASAAAVVALAVGVAVTGPSATGVTEPGTSPPPPSSGENGPHDGTRTAGPEYERGADLIDVLAGAMPPGLETPDGLVHTDPAYGGAPLRYHQVVEDLVDGTLTWDYEAIIPVRGGGGLGELEVEVTTEGNKTTGAGCELSPTFQHLVGSCTERTVGGRKVGVYAIDPGQPDYVRPYEQWASYRYPDGTVVHLAQSVRFPGAGQPPMAAQPLTQDQLVEMVTDPRFHLD